MREIAASVILVIIGAFDGLHAAYIIKLKNGNEYVTERYWQEGGQLLFETYGGTFGVEKTFVAKIEKSTHQPPRIATAKEADPATNLEPAAKEAMDKQASEPKVEKKRDEQDPIVSEYNRLRNKAQEVGGMLTTEIRELLKEITAFKNKLARDSKLFIEYGREFNEAHEIGDIVESALRSRTQ